MNAKPDPHLHSIESLLGIRLSGVALGMKALIAEALEEKEYPLSFDDWLNLLPLVRQPGITQKELSSRLGKDKTTISRQIDVLERRKLVVRRQSKADARSIELSLSDKGLRLHEEALPLISDFDASFAEGISAEELGQLGRILAKIHQNVQRRKPA